MANRLPLVRDTGKSRQMASGDALLLPGALYGPAPVAVASEAFPSLYAANSNTVTVTGTTTITGFYLGAGSVPAGTEWTVTFSGSLTLTHNDANGYHILCLSGADVVTQPGDVAVFQKTGSSNEAKMVSYSRYDGTPLVPSWPGGTVTTAINDAAEVSVASAATCAVGAAASNNVVIGGNAAISAFDTMSVGGARRVLRFVTALTLTHDATKLILPGGANITTAAGDFAEFECMDGTNWRCLWYSRASGAPLVAASDSTKLPLDGSGIMSGALENAPVASIAAATTVTLRTIGSNTMIITGAGESISSFGTPGSTGRERRVWFSGVNTLVHNSSALVLPGGANITTASGDFAEFVALSGNVWYCTNYQRADGTSLVGPSGVLKLDGSTTMTGAVNEAPYVAVSSETSPCPIGAAASNTVQITSTANISTFDNKSLGTRRTLIFTNACTLVNGTAIVLPTGANIITAVGDTAEFVQTGVSIWTCVRYNRFSGAPLVASSDSTKLPLTGGKMTGALNLATAVSLASAATVAIGAAAANTINISGTTAITAFDTIAAGARRVVVFAGILTLTYSATALILPGAASITTAAGDAAEFESLGSGNWKCLWYQCASGKPVAFAYDRSNVLAAVAQVSGVPTGGLIESGTNANGTYAKFADGTMICVKNVAVSGGSPTAKGSLYTSAVTAAGNHAAKFSSVPTVLASGTDGAGGGWPAMEVFSDNTQAGSWSLRNTSANSSAGFIYLVAFGRWFT